MLPAQYNLANRKVGIMNSFLSMKPFFVWLCGMLLVGLAAVNQAALAQTNPDLQSNTLAFDPNIHNTPIHAVANAVKIQHLPPQFPPHPQPFLSNPSFFSP